MGFLRSIFLLSLLRWCVAHYLFSTLTTTLVCCALFVFYFHLNVGVLRTIYFLLLLMRYCFAHYLFSTLIITLVFYALFSTFINTLVFCALFVLYFNYYVGVLRTICFLLELLGWSFARYLFCTLTITLVFCALFVFFLNY